MSVSQGWSRAGNGRSGWTMIPQSWYDLPIAKPVDPRDLIVNAELGGTQGVFLLSSTYSQPPSSWGASPLSLNGLPTCSTLWTDNQLAVAEANQWNFMNGTKSVDPNISPLLSNLIFLKGGSEWEMTIPLTTGGTTLTDVQLSFRDNAATSGLYDGTSSGKIPVISFTGSFTGSITLQMTLAGSSIRTQLALRTIDSLGNYGMFGLECIII